VQKPSLNQKLSRLLGKGLVQHMHREYVLPLKSKDGPDQHCHIIVKQEKTVEAEEWPDKY
jgi:hypothetical protein